MGRKSTILSLFLYDICAVESHTHSRSQTNPLIRNFFPRPLTPALRLSAYLIKCASLV